MRHEQLDGLMHFCCSPSALSPRVQGWFLGLGLYSTWTAHAACDIRQSFFGQARLWYLSSNNVMSQCFVLVVAFAVTPSKTKGSVGRPGLAGVALQRFAAAGHWIDKKPMKDCKMPRQQRIC